MMQVTDKVSLGIIKIPEHGFFPIIKDVRISRAKDEYRQEYKSLS